MISRPKTTPILKSNNILKRLQKALAAVDKIKDKYLWSFEPDVVNARTEIDDITKILNDKISNKNLELENVRLEIDSLLTHVESTCTKYENHYKNKEQLENRYEKLKITAANLEKNYAFSLNAYGQDLVQIFKDQRTNIQGALDKSDFIETQKLLDQFEFLSNFIKLQVKTNERLEKHFGLKSCLLPENDKTNAVKAFSILWDLTNKTFLYAKLNQLGTPAEQKLLKEHLIHCINYSNISHKKWDSEKHYIAKVLLNFVMAITIVAPLIKYALTKSFFLHEQTFSERTIRDIPDGLKLVK